MEVAKLTAQDRLEGCLMGLAIGDAVGTTLEFKPPGSFTEIDDMVGGGLFGLNPGEWTDDTSMTLCLGESLLEKQEFDPVDQMQRYCSWKSEGHLSSTGSCFDIGNTVSHALSKFSVSGDPFAGSTDPRSAGNGSLMRLAPIPLFYSDDVEAAIHYAAESSKTTHGAQTCIDACRYYAGLIYGALHETPKYILLSSDYAPPCMSWKDTPLCQPIDEIAQGSFKRKEPPEIKGTGYVAQSMEAALWAFHKTNDFKSGCLLAANLGDDADTTAAIYGQLAGAYYGHSGIPSEWSNLLKYRELIIDMANQLAGSRV